MVMSGHDCNYETSDLKAITQRLKKKKKKDNLLVKESGRHLKQT